MELRKFGGRHATGIPDRHRLRNCAAARPPATVVSYTVTTVPPAAADAIVGTMAGTCLIDADAGHLIAVRRRPGPPRL